MQAYQRSHRVVPIADDRRLEKPQVSPVATGAPVVAARNTLAARDRLWTADPLGGIKYYRFNKHPWVVDGKKRYAEELRATFGRNNDKIRWYTLMDTPPVTAGDLTLVSRIHDQVLEARRGESGKQWYFATARLNILHVQIFHREQLVWEAPYLTRAEWRNRDAPYVLLRQPSTETPP